ncbi:fimbria/pilus outer membrane usher protein [Modicisalibacter ilicicola]|nr:fimbria/pilus outer membrane usher protein [Halomonas ilicicola]
MPASIDEQVIGDLTVGIADNALVFVQRTSWNDIAVEHFQGEFLRRLESASSGDRISMAEFARAGLDMEFDPRRLLVILRPTQEQRVVKRLNLAPGMPDLTNVDRGRHPLTAYVNLRAVEDYVDSDLEPSGRQPLTLSLDGGVRAFGADGTALEWSAFYDEEDERRWKRGETRLVHDDVERAIRYSAGDIFYQSAEFQGAPSLLGFSVERQFSALQPFRVVTSTGQQTFTITRPSRVEVYVNDVLQSIQRLSPGRYNVSDFAFTDGLNDVRVVVEDDAGRRQTFNYSLFLDAILLDEGISEFSVNAGYQRADDFSETIEYDHDAPAWSGYYRQGITPDLTLGANYQGDQTLDVGGVEAVLGTRTGIFSGSFNASQAEEHGSGRAGTLRWNYEFDLFGTRRPQELSLASIYSSENFQSLGQDEPSATFRWQNLIRLSSQLGDTAYGSITARQGVAHSSRGADETGVGLSISKRFGRLTTSIRAEYIDGEAEETDLFLSVSLPLGSSQTWRSSYTDTDNRLRTEWSTMPRNVVGDLSGSIGVETADQGSRLLGDVTYRGNRFIARARHDYLQEGLFEDNTGQFTRVQFETGIATAEGKLAMGRPVSNAFAIVDRHESLSRTRILVNETSDGPVAIADGFGPALVPGLESYRIQNLLWRAEAPPVGYDMGDVHERIFPAYRGGFSYQAGSAASIIAMGRLLGADDAPVSLIAGTLHAADGRTFEPLSTFTNRKGRFVLQGLEPGDYEARFNTEPLSTIHFSVSSDASGYIELGNFLVMEKDDA